MLPPIARRFVAGETTAEAIEHVHTLQQTGLGAIVNILGEAHSNVAAAAADTRRYEQLLSDLDSIVERPCISVKPTQLGLAIDRSIFESHLQRIVDRASTTGGFVWIDMEAADTTEPTIDAFERLARETPDTLGVCLQSNLRRTATDLERLQSVPGNIRLVKGAYSEPTAIAYTDREAVNAAFRTDLEYLFEHYGGGIAVATHDPAMIDLACRLHEETGTAFEFQMLMGVRTAEQRRLAREYDTWQYVPFGNRWLPYFSRRVFERKENLRFALRAILRH